jgi:hypothetical protein
MERMFSFKRTLGSFASPSTRRIGRSNSRDENARKSRALTRQSSKLGALFRFRRRGEDSEEVVKPGDSDVTAMSPWDESPSPRNEHINSSPLSQSKHVESPPSTPKPIRKPSTSFREPSTRPKEHLEKARPQSYRLHDARASKDSDQDDSNKRMSRKPSKLRMMFFAKTERPAVVVMTDQMIRLETVIQSDKGRQHLVQQLLSLRGDHAVKVRFCAAVDKFDACFDEHERAALAEALIQTFLVHGCMFYISSLSEVRAYAIIVEGNHNQLLDAKREVLESLSKDADVMRIVDIVETLDDV